jgi:hypothetical protein
MPSITYTVTQSDYSDFKQSFLTAFPVPVEPFTGANLFTDEAWIKEWGKRTFLHAYKRGKKMIAESNAVINETIVT